MKFIPLLVVTAWRCLRATRGMPRLRARLPIRVPLSWRVTSPAQDRLTATPRRKGWDLDSEHRSASGTGCRRRDDGARREPTLPRPCLGMDYRPRGPVHRLPAAGRNARLAQPGAAQDAAEAQRRGLFPREHRARPRRSICTAMRPSERVRLARRLRLAGSADGKNRLWAYIPKMASGSSGINASAVRRCETASSMRLNPISMLPSLRRV